jgi:hypothetical protein
MRNRNISQVADACIDATEQKMTGPERNIVDEINLYHEFLLMKNTKIFLLVIVLSFLVAAFLSAEGIVPIDEIRRGEFVMVRGEVFRVPDYDEFFLQDDSGRVKIDLGDQLRRPVARRGDTVTVSGWVDDDSLMGPLEIYAVEIILQDGTVIEIDRRED